MPHRIATLLSLLLVVGSVPAAAAEEGLALSRIREVRVSGRVFDSATGQSLPGALVTVEGTYENRRADTGPEGEYVVTASAENGLGTISVAFAHVDYQQKYLETLFRDAFPKKIDLVISGQRVTAKDKKAGIDLSCGQSGSLAMRSGAAKVSTVCAEGLVGVSLEMRRNRVAVLAREPFTLRIEDGRLEVRDTQATAVEVRVDAAMLLR